MSFPYNSADIGNRIFKPIQNDAVERLRVANPQSLIDTDFEYGLQPTKWETLELMNNIPSFYSKTDDNILPAEALVGLSANLSTSSISVSTVPADVSAWPDPQPTDNGNAPLPNGWLHWSRNSSYGDFYIGATVSPFVMPFQINVGNGNTNVLYFQGSGALSIGNISGGFTYYNNLPYADNYLTCTGCITGSVLMLSAGNTSTSGGEIDQNIFDESPVKKFTGTQYEFDEWPLQRVLTIINDGRLGGGSEFTNYQYPYHTTMKRVYYKRLDTDAVNDRMVFYVFTAGPGATFWSGSTFIRSNQSLNWGKEPSRVVWEVYRFQPIIKVTTVRGCSGLDSWSEQTNGPTGASNGPLLNRRMFTQFGVTNGANVLYNEGPNSTTNNLLVGSAKLVNYSTIASHGGATLRVNSSYTPVLSAGEPIVLDGTFENLLDGSALVVNASAGASFNQYNIVPRRRVQNTALSLSQNYITPSTSVYRGGFYSNASIPFTSIVPTPDTTTVTITTPTPHNMFLNQPFFVVDPTKSIYKTFPWIGAFSVYSIPSSTSFTYRVQSDVFQESVFTDTAATKLYLRPEGIARHRFTDGGVQITTANSSPFSQIIRQTRNYFRYQSGKSILFSTGLLFEPTYDVESFTVNTQPYYSQTEPFLILSIKTEQPHGFAVSIPFLEGPTIRTRDFTVRSGNNRYNDTFKVNSVADDYNFTVKIPVSSSFTNLYSSSAYVLPGDLSPGGNPKIDVVDYNDAIVQSGMFDEQNGIFFRYEKNKLLVGRRTSTLNLAGTVAVTNESSIVEGVNTKFLSQLQVGDYIAIRGISFVVTSILSNTRLTISPKYSGITSNGIKIVKTVDTVVSQDNFNLDKLDGTGPSGYVIDLNKMQMIYFDYSWYGAGRIRWGVRGTNGDIIYCHEMPNNNVNTEAYMRSGNLPARFEIFNKPQQGTVTRSDSTRVSVTNTVSPSAILVNIVRSETPQGPFFSFSPPLTSLVIPYQDVPANIAFIYNLDNNGTNTGAIKQPPVSFDNTITLKAGAVYSNFSKFGTGSVLFDGLTGGNTSSYGSKPSLSLVSYPQLIPASWTAGDFSIECFVYFKSFRSNDSTYNAAPDPEIFCNGYQYWFLGSQDYGFSMRATASEGSTTSIKTSLGQTQQNAGGTFRSSTNVLTLSTWHHVVWQRSNYVTQVFVDGISVISTPDNNMYDFAFYDYVPVFGAKKNAGGGMVGYMDGIRGVFQAAPYPVNGFIPPTQPFESALDYQAFAPVINRDILNLENNYYTAYTIPTSTFPFRRELLTTQTITTTAATLTVSPSSTFSIPNTGTILIGQEYINYNKIGTKSSGDQVIQLVNRNIAGLTYVPAHSLMQGGVAINNRVLSFNNNCSPALSHWGVSVLMDGEFNDDKSYLFTASMSGFALPQSSSVDYPLISIRLAPAADYGVGSVVGVRNLINRSIITLNDIQIVTRQAANITVKINSDSALWDQASRWQAAGNGSLAQYMDHSTNTSRISGGVTVFGFLAGEQDSGRNQVTDQDINIIRNLGNSILGGNRAFPDGPDILTVYTRPFTTSVNNRTLAKISWQEAQG